MSDPLLWRDVPDCQRAGWDRRDGAGCPAACLFERPAKWRPLPTFTRCHGYVKPGDRWCHSHDPSIQTAEKKAKTRARIEEGRRRRGLLDARVSNWVGEGEYSS